MAVSRAARDVAVIGLIGAAVLFALGERWPALVVALAAALWIAIDAMARRQGNWP